MEEIVRDLSLGMLKGISANSSLPLLKNCEGAGVKVCGPYVFEKRKRTSGYLGSSCPV